MCLVSINRGGATVWRPHLNAQRSCTLKLCLLLVAFLLVDCSSQPQPAVRAPVEGSPHATVGSTPNPAWVLYLQRQSTPGFLFGIAWDGRVRSEVAMPAGSSGPHPSFDGTEMIVDVPAAGRHAREVVTTAGKVLAILDVHNVSQWSVNSDDICTLTNPIPERPTASSLLTVLHPGATSRTVAVLSGPSPSNAGVVHDLQVCNVRRDFAVISDEFAVDSQGRVEFITRHIHIIQLSTGKTVRELGESDLAERGRVTVAPSGDIYASGLPSEGGSRLGDVGTEIRLTDRQLTGIPLAFSDDGSRLLMGVNPGTVDFRDGGVFIVDVMTSATIWSAVGRVLGYRAEPGGGAFALTMANDPTYARVPTSLIVSGSGRVRILGSNETVI